MNRPPAVTATLILALCGVFALELQAGGNTACEIWGFVPAHPSLQTAAMSLFLHDPSDVWGHLGANLVFLAVFGVIVEGALGSVAFGALYLAAGLGGAAAHWALNMGSATPLVGASGALFGLLAVAAVLRPRMLGFIVPYVGFTVWQICTRSGGTVSAAAHIGGFVVGAIVAAALRATRSEALEAA